MEKNVQITNKKENTIKNKLNRIDIRTYTMIVVLAVMWLGFTYLTSGSFISPRNVSNLVRQMAIVGIMGTGMVLVIVSGGIDLSAGSVMGFLGCIAAALQVWGGFGTIETMLICIAGGLLIGLLQGGLIAYTGVAPFIITLGGQLAFRGAILAVTRGTTVAPLQKSFLYIGQEYISNNIGIILGVVAIILLFVNEIIKQRSKSKYKIEEQKSFSAYIRLVIQSLLILFAIFVVNQYKGIPVPVLIMLVLVIVFTFIAEKTTFGRRIYAIGGNIEAAKYSGINIKKNIIAVYVLNGFMAAIAGLILTARLNAGTPQAGMNLELDAIAAAVIGGTSMTGGVGKVSGAILGALVMATIDNGMSMMNLDAYWQYIVKGIILVVAVIFDIKTRSKAKTNTDK